MMEFGFDFSLIQSASILKILSCLVLNLDNAWGELQWDNTCLFVCLEPQREQLSMASFFHFCKLAAVGNCCKNAFRIKIKRCVGKEFIWDDQFYISDLENDSFIARGIIPCDLREKIWSCAFWLMDRSRSLPAFFLSSNLETKLSN